MIADRPPEVEDRAVPGHWEGDLIIGTREGHSQIGTLVERTSRYLMLVHLPNDRKAETVREAIARKIQQLPTSLTRTLPGIKVTKWPNTPDSASTPASRSISATRTAPGSGAPSKTPTGSSANTSLAESTTRH